MNILYVVTYTESENLVSNCENPSLPQNIIIDTETEAVCINLMCVAIARF